jgi:hypothetical protein
MKTQIQAIGFLLVLFCSCSQDKPTNKAFADAAPPSKPILTDIDTPIVQTEEEADEEALWDKPVEEAVEWNETDVLIEGFKEFGRDRIKARLQQKINAGIPLVAHVFVPLCDNYHQGIVPVNERLGDGLNLRTNLYWGAGYGIKTHFKRSWELVYAQKDISENVLERCVFYKVMPNGAKVYLVADAYRGDRMKQCLQDYFRSHNGHLSDSLTIGDLVVPTYGNADLLAFNGHNGLMDTQVRLFQKTDSTYHDAVVIACDSKPYFKQQLGHAKGFPLLMTKNFLAPEGYAIEAAIIGWAVQEDGTAIRSRVGAAYHKYQKCGLRGATNLFTTGW